MALAALNTQQDVAIKILVVEDDVDLREALSDTLQLADYDVIAADCAEEALKQLALHDDVAMIVSDVNMGAMSGHDLLLEVKQQHPQIPMLLITAYASISQSVDAMREGAVDYLVKPFAFIELQARVEALSRRVQKGFSEQSQLNVADLIVDLLSRKVLEQNKVLVYSLENLDC